MPNKPQSRRSDIVMQELKNETLIYDLKINKAFCLNQTSAMTYQLSDGTKSAGEIAALMSKTLNTQISEDLVWLALDQLKQNDLLAEAKKMEINFGGSSRREVIRKIGLSSLVVLPVISSLVAPTAAAAQSGNFAPGSRTLEQSCNTSVDCAGSAPFCSRYKTCCVNVSDGSNTPSGSIVVSTGFVDTGTTCSSFTDAQKNADCGLWGVNCCSGSASYQSGSCTEPRPDSIRYNCVCN